MHITQRKRREYLTVVLLVQLTYEGSVESDSDTLSKVQKIVNIALGELESPLPRQREKDYRAAFRLAYKTMGEWAKTHKGDLAGEKVVLTTYCLLELLHANGAVSFSQDSPLAAIMDWMLSCIDADDPITQKRLANAQKQAAYFLSVLQKEGYFI